MKNGKRIISWLLAAAMLLPLASCSETTTDEGKTDAENAAAEQPAGESEEIIEEETRLPLGIPETADFGGQDIKFLVWTHPSWVATVREYRDIYSEGINGEAINDTVYNRNLKVQDNYNVIISQERMELGQISGTLSKEVTAGTNTYSVYYPRLYEGASMYQKNYFHNLLDLENMDLTQPWWDTSCVKALSVVGRLPAVATSLNVNDKDATAAVAFNKDAAANYQLEDLYTIVREGDPERRLQRMCVAGVGPAERVGRDARLHRGRGLSGLPGAYRACRYESHLRAGSRRVSELRRNGGGGRHRWKRPFRGGEKRGVPGLFRAAGSASALREPSGRVRLRGLSKPGTAGGGDHQRRHVQEHL